MALAQEDIQFIKDHLGEWLAEQSLGKPPAVYEIELRERMDRFMIWSFGTTLGAAGLVVTLVKFWNP
ncbi:hypothetical protein CKO31_02985 [Thiohalocapsa halophila]|uniref:DUF2157 domain-containing protein n=1 Tax=Thiohalocapsa halophila TaxID=69359 RepID=A0ABS1CCU4_9GAMM|nr:hypothetical protein [Thiohalocapsa halophila]MBK1629720.1 hypothetical protein [Thiohalocapsa halophila]